MSSRLTMKRKKSECLQFRKGMDTKHAGKFPIHPGRTLIDLRERDSCGQVVGIEKALDDDDY